MDTHKWRDIPGEYSRNYRINEDGEVQRMNEVGMWIPVSACLDSGNHRGAKRLVVSLRMIGGKYRKVPVKHLMAEVYLGFNHEPGLTVINKNGIPEECDIGNILVCTMEESRRLQKSNGRKSVAKIDQKGNIIEVYHSIGEAASKNFISHKSVSMRCTGEIKNPFKLLNGYSFRYEV